MISGKCSNRDRESVRVCVCVCVRACVHMCVVVYRVVHAVAMALRITRKRCSTDRFLAGAAPMSFPQAWRKTCTWRSLGTGFLSRSGHHGVVHERRQGLSGRIENRQCRGRGLSAEFVHVMQRRASRVEREHNALVVIPSNRACSVVIRRKFSSGHHGAISRRNGQPPGRRKMAKCARLFYKPRTPIRTERRTCSRFL